MANYTDKSITTISGLQHMRKHAGMWSFDRDSQQGLYQMTKEVFDNAIDEASIDKDNQHIINVTFLRQPSSFQVIIEDEGRGVPLNKLYDSFMRLFTSAKSEKVYNKTIGAYGVGVKATTALSRRMCVISKRAEGSAIVTSHQAECIHRKVSKTKNKDKSTFGTTVMFEPDTSILSQTKYFFDEGNGFYDFIELIEFVCMLYKNVSVNVYVGKGRLKDDSVIGEPLDVLKTLKACKDNCKLAFSSVGTVSPEDYLRNKYNISSSTIWETKIFNNETKDDSFDYHLQFIMTKDYTNRVGQILTSVNAIQMYTKNTAQVEAPISAIKTRLVEFIEDKDIKTFFLGSYSLPLHLITLAWDDNASFENQRKDAYKCRKFLTKYTKALDTQFKALGVDYWDNLYTLLQEDIESKYHKFHSRGMNIGGSMKNLAYSLNKPGSYCACRLKDPNQTELFIVEGDSAMTTIKQICDRESQAIMMLGGKPLNPFKKDISARRKNLVYQDLIKVLGVQPGDKDLSNLNFSRVNILADADLKNNLMYSIYSYLKKP